MEMKEQFYNIYNLFKKFKIMNKFQLFELKKCIHLNYLIMLNFSWINKSYNTIINKLIDIISVRGSLMLKKIFFSYL